MPINLILFCTLLISLIKLRRSKQWLQREHWAYRTVYCSTQHSRTNLRRNTYTPGTSKKYIYLYIYMATQMVFVCVFSFIVIGDRRHLHPLHLHQEIIMKFKRCERCKMFATWNWIWTATVSCLIKQTCSIGDAIIAFWLSPDNRWRNTLMEWVVKSSWLPADKHETLQNFHIIPLMSKTVTDCFIGLSVHCEWRYILIRKTLHYAAIRFNWW